FLQRQRLREKSPSTAGQRSLRCSREGIPTSGHVSQRLSFARDYFRSEILRASSKSVWHATFTRPILVNTLSLPPIAASCAGSPARLAKACLGRTQPLLPSACAGFGVARL